MHTPHILRIAVLCALVLVLQPGLVTGQSLTAVGFKAGLTRADQRRVFAGFESVLDSRSGVDVGIFAEWFDHPWIRVNSEIHFVRKNVAFPDMPITTAQYPDGTGQFIETSLTFDCVSATIMPKVRSSFGSVQVYGMFGPRIDVVVHRAANIGGPDPLRSVLQQSFESHLRHYTDVVIGADVALGFQVPELLLGGVGLEVRYSPDITTSYDIPNSTATNRSWEFLLTVAL